MSFKAFLAEIANPTTAQRTADGLDRGATEPLPTDPTHAIPGRTRISDEGEESTTLETLSLLSKENMAEKRLDVFWKVDFVDKRVKAAIDSLIAQEDDGLVRLLKRRTTGLSTKDIRASLGRALVQVDFPVIRFPRQAKDEKRRQRIKGGSRERSSRSGTKLSDLIEAGLIRPPFSIEATWRKQSFTATILRDGDVSFDGNIYSSLSTAGGMARNIASGPPPDGRKFWQTNGWTFWKY